MLHFLNIASHELHFVAHFQDDLIEGLDQPFLVLDADFDFRQSVFGMGQLGLRNENAAIVRGTCLRLDAGSARNRLRFRP